MSLQRYTNTTKVRGGNTTSRRFSNRKSNSPYKRRPDVEIDTSVPPPKHFNPDLDKPGSEVEFTPPFERSPPSNKTTNADKK